MRHQLLSSPTHLPTWAIHLHVIIPSLCHHPLHCVDTFLFLLQLTPHGGRSSSFCCGSNTPHQVNTLLTPLGLTHTLWDTLLRFSSCSDSTPNLTVAAQLALSILMALVLNCARRKEMEESDKKKKYLFELHETKDYILSFFLNSGDILRK